MGLRVRPITLGLRRIVMRGTGTGRRIVIRPAATSEGGPAISERRLLPNTVGTPGQTVVVNDAGTAVEYVDAPSGPVGPAGPAGPAGPTGPAGPQGDTVADGVLSGQLTLPGVYISGQANAAIAATFVYAHTFVVCTPRTVSGLRIYVNIAASGKFARLGIIKVDTGWQSAIAPIVDAGAVTVGSTGEQTATFSTITLQPGRYCTILVSDGAPTLNFLVGPSFAGISASLSYSAVAEFSAAMTYGAFPTPWNLSLTADYFLAGGRWAVRLVP